MSKLYFFMDSTPPPPASPDRLEAWMPKGDVSYFDKAARRTFDSRREKRAWLRQHGMRETGELYKAEPPSGEGAMRRLPRSR